MFLGMQLDVQSIIDLLIGSGYFYFSIRCVTNKQLHGFGQHIGVTIRNPAFHFAFVEFDNEYVRIYGFEDPFFLNDAVSSPVGLQPDLASYERFQVFSYI
jgi:hypothetical protein